MALVQWCCGASYFLLSQDCCGYVLVSSLFIVLVRSYTLGFVKGVGFFGRDDIIVTTLVITLLTS